MLFRQITIRNFICLTFYLNLVYLGSAGSRCYSSWKWGVLGKNPCTCWKKRPRVTGNLDSVSTFVFNQYVSFSTFNYEASENLYLNDPCWYPNLGRVNCAVLSLVRNFVLHSSLCIKKSRNAWIKKLCFKITGLIKVHH